MVGYYKRADGTVIRHAVAHCPGDSGTVVIEPIEGSRFSKSDAEYTEYNYLEYDMAYSDTIPVKRQRSSKMIALPQ